MAQSIEQLSFELSSDELAEQERTLSSLRSCASTVLGAASVASSFLVAKASHGSLDAWAILAMVAFVLCLACSVWVLLPHEFVFVFRGDSLLTASDRSGMSDQNEAYRAIGVWVKPHVWANRGRIASLATWLTASCGLLALEVVLWTISVTR